MKIYTKTGDDGTTALYSGDRVRKDALVIELNGTIDEAQAALGLARVVAPDEVVNELLISCERDLWVLMAEVATPDTSMRTSGAGGVTDEMVHALEVAIDSLLSQFSIPHNFTVPGETRVSAALDFARTVVRRAERIAVADGRTGNVVVYLNRLSDLCWTLARYCEDEHLLSVRSATAPLRVDRKDK